MCTLIFLLGALFYIPTFPAECRCLHVIKVQHAARRSQAANGGDKAVGRGLRQVVDEA